MKAFLFNCQPCIEIDNLWQALYQMFNLAQNHQVDLNLWDKFVSKQLCKWSSFSKKEFKSTIIECNNLSIPRLDHIL